MENQILIIVAHGDDEVLGCGGTIAKHSSQGDQVHLLIVSDGESAREKDKEIISKIDKRIEATKKAGEILGIKSFNFLGLSDNRLDKYQRLEIIKSIESFIKKINPEIIYTHHFGDLNIDHEIVFESVATACRPYQNNNVKKIFSFEVLSSTEWQLNTNTKIFMPNYFVNISKFIINKKEAMKCYQMELRDWPHPRSLKGIESLAEYRGLQSGFNYAEAFYSSRILVE